MAMTTLAWALERTGMEPGEKLLLVILADACGMDNRVFGDLDEIFASACVLPEEGKDVLRGLNDKEFLFKTRGRNPSGGAEEWCIELTAPNPEYF
jgi:hypothetical protein